MCYHADFGQARPDCVAISRGVPKDDALGLRPLGSGRDWTPRMRPSHMSQHAEFGRFTSKGVNISRVPKNGVRWEPR